MMRSKLNELCSLPSVAHSLGATVQDRMKCKLTTEAKKSRCADREIHPDKRSKVIFPGIKWAAQKGT